MNIVLKRNGRVESEYKLSEGSNFSIGRRGFSNQIELDDPAVSRNHAKIAFNNGKIVVFDLGSTNGTHWNSKRLPPNTPVTLNEKGSLKLGNQSVYELLIQEDSAAPPVATNKTMVAPSMPKPETSHESNGYIPHFSGRKWGFVDKRGENVIPYKYDEVLFFKNGIAAIRLNGKYGLINDQGRIIVPASFDEILYMTDCLIAISVDKPLTDHVGVPVDLEQNLASGLAMAAANGKFGFVGRNGAEALPCRYDRKIDFSSGMAKVRISGNNPLLDNSGNELIPIMHFTNQYVSEGLACVRVGQRWGMVDENGHTGIPLQYEKIRFFQSGMAPACSKGKWGFIDKHNNEVVSFRFEDALSFSEGLAAVKQQGRWGFVDPRGNQVIPCRFDYVSSFHRKFADRWKVNADGVLVIN